MLCHWEWAYIKLQKVRKCYQSEVTRNPTQLHLKDHMVVMKGRPVIKQWINWYHGKYFKAIRTHWHANDWWVVRERKCYYVQESNPNEPSSMTCNFLFIFTDNFITYSHLSLLTCTLHCSYWIWIISCNYGLFSPCICWWSHAYTLLHTSQEPSAYNAIIVSDILKKLWNEWSRDEMLSIQLVPISLGLKCQWLFKQYQV